MRAGQESFRSAAGSATRISHLSSSSGQIFTDLTFYLLCKQLPMDCFRLCQISSFVMFSKTHPVLLTLFLRTCTGNLLLLGLYFFSKSCL